jgi:GH25 family lysozyme M1 (1,4-beta-N-acetylmuramidase)
MYDSVSVSEIPASAKAVAGYVGGHWPTYNQLRLKFPKAHKLSIAIAANENADCLDVEPGDAVISQAAGWVKRQKAAGARKPVVYTSLSQAQLLINTLARAGLPRASYRLWTAHYTDKPHRCTPICGLGFKSKADATQYTDKALGRNLDASLCSPAFFADG